MHGVKRLPKNAATAEARAARKAKEAAKLEAYLEIERTFFTHKREGRKDATALEHTTKLLTLNPELYTVWNYRRQILLHLFASSEGEHGVEAEAGAKPDVFASLRDVRPAADKAETDVADEGADEREARWSRNRALLEDDLMLTEHALRAHPKVYWIWNHRRWCLTQNPPPPPSTAAAASSTSTSEQWVWERELKLVEKMLDLDPRNFHGWNWRRAIVEHLALSLLSSHSSTAPLAATQPSFPALLSHPSLLAADVETQRGALLTLAERELAYALRKIESNFSNFSAWHQRTKLLPHVWAAQRLTAAEVDARIDAELELVKQAMYTDPSDQSVWFYHRWLVEQLFPAPTTTTTEAETIPQQQEQEAQEGRRARQLRVLHDEIAVIDELFELEPDSKWCAISLAHYHMLLAGLHAGEAAEAEACRAKADSLLHRLVELDPDRQARYRDLLDGRAHF